MNIFRLLGDLSHLLAIIILLQKIWKTRSCAGTSVTILFIRLHLSLSCHRSWNFALLFVHCSRTILVIRNNSGCFRLLQPFILPCWNLFYLIVFFFPPFSLTKPNIVLSELDFKIRLSIVNFGFSKDSTSYKDETFWGLSKLDRWSFV